MISNNSTCLESDATGHYHHQLLSLCSSLLLDNKNPQARMKALIGWNTFYQHPKLIYF